MAAIRTAVAMRVAATGVAEALGGAEVSGAGLVALVAPMAA